MFTVSKDRNCLRIGLKFDVLLSFRFNFFPTHVHGPRFNATWLYRVDFPVKIFKHITMFLRGIIFIQKKLTKKSYPKISHIKNFIQKFYPKMFLSKIYVTFLPYFINEKFKFWLRDLFYLTLSLRDLFYLTLSITCLIPPYFLFV